MIFKTPSTEYTIIDNAIINIIPDLFPHHIELTKLYYQNLNFLSQGHCMPQTKTRNSEIKNKIFTFFAYPYF